MTPIEELKSVYKRHTKLIKDRQDEPEIVRAFVQKIVQLGKHIHRPQDRRLLQSMLNYWRLKLWNTSTPLDTKRFQLEEFQDNRQLAEPQIDKWLAAKDMSYEALVLAIPDAFYLAKLLCSVALVEQLAREFADERDNKQLLWFVLKKLWEVGKMKGVPFETYQELKGKVDEILKSYIASMSGSDAKELESEIKSRGFGHRLYLACCVELFSRDRESTQLVHGELILIDEQEKIAVDIILTLLRFEPLKYDTPSVVYGSDTLTKFIEGNEKEDENHILSILEKAFILKKHANGEYKLTHPSIISVIPALKSKVVDAIRGIAILRQAKLDAETRYKFLAAENDATIQQANRSNAEAAIKDGKEKEKSKLWGSLENLKTAEKWLEIDKTLSVEDRTRVKKFIMESRGWIERAEQDRQLRILTTVFACTLGVILVGVMSFFWQSNNGWNDSRIQLEEQIELASDRLPTQIAQETTAANEAISVGIRNTAIAYSAILETQSAGERVVIADLGTQVADLAAELAATPTPLPPPTFTPTPQRSEAADAPIPMSSATPTLAPSPISTQIPTPTPTGLAVFLSNKVFILESTATPLPTTTSTSKIEDLYAIVPNANFRRFQSPLATDLGFNEFLPADDNECTIYRVIDTNVSGRVRLRSIDDPSVNYDWVTGNLLTFYGDETILPGWMRPRVINNQVEGLDSVYVLNQGRTTKNSADYTILTDPNNAQSTLRSLRIPEGWFVTVLQVVRSGIGDQTWYLVTLEGSPGTRVIWNVYIPADVIRPAENSPCSPTEIERIVNRKPEATDK